jgi:preprotein translocase subunit SecD
LILVVVWFLGSRADSLFVSDLQAAVRFEVKLAENQPSPGLREVKTPDSEKPVYMHQQVIVTNSEIESTRVRPGEAPGRYAVEVEFTASGAKKMRRATAAHIGKPMAVLIDGQVVMTPIVRSTISASAAVTGNFTKAEAERIVTGIGLQQ